MCSPFYYTKSDLIKAFSSGYEHGHYGTVTGNGHPEEHDEIASDWIDEALKDGTFKRELNI